MTNLRQSVWESMKSAEFEGNHGRILMSVHGTHSASIWWWTLRAIRLHP